MRATLVSIWASWLAMTTVISLFLCYALTSEQSSTRKVYLPGKTTHGHYQIELACHTCHTPLMGVKQDACTDCHAEELKSANDTHPATKFNDPTNADRLAILDAQKCITCHREHVPHLTHNMGLSLPTDYCYHCHQDVGEQRPSHVDLEHNSCATAGCHNYHDNTALYEKFLFQHAGEPDFLEDGRIPSLSTADHRIATKGAEGSSLTVNDADHPVQSNPTEKVLHDWHASAHAAAGVNCSACHRWQEDAPWSDEVDHQACKRCHEEEAEGFLQGRHGMRLALGMSPMQPRLARQPMKSDAYHQELTCSSCHADHRYDTSYAAVDACLSCHDDAHSLAYENSSHFRLWQEEVTAESDEGTGVSCASCHLPREERGKRVVVQHNQNANLRPNEKMIRSVCIHCHGLQFSLDSLADRELIDRCFDGPPDVAIKSVEMAVKWFEDKERKRRARQAKKGGSDDSK